MKASSRPIKASQRFHGWRRPLVALAALGLFAGSLSPLEAKDDALTVVFPGRGDTTELKKNADALATWLSSELKIEVKASVAEETAAVEALRANRADVAFLSSRPALKAEQLAGAKLYLAEVRPNYSEGHKYKSVFVVRTDSPLQPGADAKATLGQLKGKRMAFTSPTSGSGFIFPVANLVKAGLVPNRDAVGSYFGQVMYGDNYTGAIRAVIRQQADVAAVSEYALHPPYITPEEQKQIRVLHAISGVPAHGVVIDDDVDAALRQKLLTALQKLNEPANNALLRPLYNANRLVPVDHAQHLEPLREALKLAGIEL